MQKSGYFHKIPNSIVFLYCHIMQCSATQCNINHHVLIHADRQACQTGLPGQACGPSMAVWLAGWLGGWLAAYVCAGLCGIWMVVSKMPGWRFTAICDLAFVAACVCDICIDIGIGVCNNMCIGVYWFVLMCIDVYWCVIICNIVY